MKLIFLLMFSICSISMKCFAGEAIKELELEKVVRSLMTQDEKNLLIPASKRNIFHSELNYFLAEARWELCSLNRPYHCGVISSFRPDKYRLNKEKKYLDKQIDVCQKTGHPVACRGAIEEVKNYKTQLGGEYNSRLGEVKFKKLLNISLEVESDTKKFPVPEDQIDLLRRCYEKKNGACVKLFWDFDFVKTYSKCINKKSKFCKLVDEVFNAEEGKASAEICASGNDYYCSDLMREDKERLLANCLDKTKPSSSKSCVWIIEDKVKIPSEEKAFVFEKACSIGSFCFEARQLVSSKKAKERLLLFACANDSNDARCRQIKDKKIELLLVRCSIYSGNYCFGYIRQKLKNHKAASVEKTPYFQTVDRLCSAGYITACSEASRLVIEKDIVKGIDYLEMICSDEFSSRDGCIDMASAQFIHGSIDSSRSIIENMVAWGYLENVDENVEWMKKNGKKRYSSFLKGIDEFIEIQ